MPATQLPLAPAQLHRNQQLFSDYFLDQLLPQRADWRALADEAAPVLRELRALFAGFVPSSIEAQTEDDLIKPVLAALGHTVEVQAALRTPDGTKKPDYILYSSLAVRDANTEGPGAVDREAGGVETPRCGVWARSAHPDGRGNTWTAQQAGRKEKRRRE
jgi:hypothetical protein